MGSILIMYGTEGCMFCDLAIKVLEAKGIDYAYVDVAEDKDAMKLFKENNLKTVPQFFLDNDYLGTYNELRVHLNGD